MVVVHIGLAGAALFNDLYMVLTPFYGLVEARINYTTASSLEF